MGERKQPTPEEVAAAYQPSTGFDDMTKMEDMNEQTLLANVKDRYNIDVIHTYCSAILVVLNPFKFLEIYNQAWVVRYKGHRLGIQPPHLYAIAEASYSTMADERKDVSVIISGESGAGKTECTKLLLRFLAARMDKVSKTETMLLETVPILDVLGNAKTVRNDNSSRFGKYIEIIFDTNNFIAGSKITHYLLEKSRITWQAEGERNYHFFYQITEGATDEDRAITLAQKALEYRMLSLSGCIKIAKVDEVADMKSTKKAFTLFGIDQDTQNSIFKLTSAVLYLGNILYKNNANGASVMDGPKSEAGLEAASKLIDVEKNLLLSGIRTKRLNVRGEITIVELNAEKARDATDSLAKYLYALSFDWVIKKINESLFADKYTSKNFIGVLDIFGFENFKFNSLEQLLINFANEKLQKFFNHHIFSMEQEEYEKEKINWQNITFKDNQECLDLIEKKPTGLLPLLDEECRFPKATDSTYLQKVNTNCEKHPYFAKLKIVKSTFKVLHYAGLVEYDVTGWLEKNADELAEHTSEMLQKSPNKYVSFLFTPSAEEIKAREEAEKAGKKGSKGGSKLTVGGQFRLSLIALTEKMMATAPYFVRCIKPNMQKSPNNFNADDVQAQLKYAGMLETIRIRRLGYPIRYAFKEFYQRFKCLVHSQYHNSGDFETRVNGMLPHINLAEGQFQKGLTKVFLKQEASYVLEDRRAVRLGEVLLVAQSWYRMINLRKIFKERKNASRLLEAWFRARTARKKFKEETDSIRRIQNLFRTIKAIAAKKLALKKKREQEEEELRKREEELRKKVKEGKMTEEQMKATLRSDLEKKTENLLKQAREGQNMIDSLSAEEEEAERKRLEAEAREAAPVIAAVDTTIYCPPVMSIGLKWFSDKVVDLDLAAICLDKSGYVHDVCFYNSGVAEGDKKARITTDLAIRFSGDDRMGNKKDLKADNETITFDFNKVHGLVRYIGIVVTTYSDGYCFSDTSDPSVELRDASKKVLFSTQIKEDMSRATDGKAKHTCYIPVILAKSGEKWIANPEEKLYQAQRWGEALPHVQKLLLNQKLIPPLEGEKPYPKPFRFIKGEEIVITSNITKLMCSLSWVGNVDLDLACLTFRYKDFVDHIDPVRHRVSKDDAIYHKGDSKVGKGQDDEKVYVDLTSITRKVNSIFFLVTVFVDGMEGGFSLVKDAYVKLVDATNLKEVNEPDRELTRFVLSTSCGTRSAQIMCKLWRVGPSKWHVIAMGEPSTGLFYLHLIPKVQPFLDEAPARKVYQITIHSGKNLPADLLPYFRVRFDADSVKTKQIKKAGSSNWKEVLYVSGQASALDIGIFHKHLGKDKFFGQIFVSVDGGQEYKKKSFKLEDRGKKKEKISSEGELCVSVEDITGTPAALELENKDKKKKSKKSDDSSSTN